MSTPSYLGHHFFACVLRASHTHRPAACHLAPSLLPPPSKPTSPTMGVLHAGDVVMKVDEIKVANDGTIPFRFGERVALRYYFSQLFPGDKARGASEYW